MNHKMVIFFACILRIGFSQPMDWCQYFPEDPHMSGEMASVAIDRDGGVWASNTSSGCLFYISKENIDDCRVKLKRIKEFDRYTLSDIVASKQRDIVWYFRSDSVYAFDIKSLEIESVVSYEETEAFITSALELNDGRIIVGDQYGHLKVYEAGNWTAISGPADSIPLYPGLEDEKGTVWCFTRIHGIFTYDGTAWASHNSSNSNIGSDKFRGTSKNIFEQQNGHIIISTYEDGLYEYDGITWQPYARPLPSEEAKLNFSVIQDSSCAFWVEALPGIMRYDGTGWYTYPRRSEKRYESPPTVGMSDVAVDYDNRVWFATRHDGLFMVNQKSELSCIDSRRIVITEPNDFTTWSTDTRRNIEFDTYGYIYSVWIEYQVNDGEWVQIHKARDDFPNNFAYFSWNTPSEPSTRYKIRLTDLADTTIRTVSDYFTIAEGDENLPPILQNIPDSLEAKSEETTTWSAQATDPEGDPVTFTFSELPSWATVSQSTLTLDPTRNDSSTTVRVIAYDSNGGADTADLYIVVSHATSTEWGINAAGPPANMLHVGKKKINLHAGKVKRVTLFNVQGKMIATADKNIEYANLFRITRNITDSFVVAKIEYADKTSVQRTICLME